MSKKRGRELPTVDTALVEIYEDLAHEDEEVRLKAAHTLLFQHIPNAPKPTLVTVLRRLFRGLCSGRKAARLGFSVALTEALSGLKDGDDVISVSEVLDILESTTVPESNTSGQDERDHFFGRLFGSDAVIKSGIVFAKSDLTQWQRLLDLVLGVSERKPWLRQECGWILFSCVPNHLKEPKQEDFAVEILHKLSEHRLIKTPEGVAIWLQIRKVFPAARLPRNVWSDEDPLSAKEITTLAKVLKDAKTESKEEPVVELQGSAIWSGQLHFVWDVVISELFESSSHKERVSFDKFWQVAVDEGLFAPSNSSERKHWGLLLFSKACASAPPAALSVCFTKNATSCLMQSLKTKDRYLQRSAQRVVQSMNHRAKIQPTAIPNIIGAFLRCLPAAELDATAVFKIVEGLLESCDNGQILEITDLLSELFQESWVNDEVEATKRCRDIINLQLKFLIYVSNTAITSGNFSRLEAMAVPMKKWASCLRNHASRQQINSVRENQQPPTATIQSSMQDKVPMIREKLLLAFEQALKMGRPGRFMVLDTVLSYKRTKLKDDTHLDAEPAIKQLIESGWQELDDLVEKSYALPVSRSKKGKRTSDSRISENQQVVSDQWQSLHDDTVKAEEGLALLYGLVLWQIHGDDDVDAVQVLQELLEIEQDQQVSFEVDALVEIILTFASKPSKFLRKITMDIFRSFTSQITKSGLESLINVLETKETSAGQSELFEADAEGSDIAGSDDELDSDVEMLDPDVQVEDEDSDSESDSAEGSDSESSTAGENDKDESAEEHNDDLFALEASLASALGTRKLTSNDLGESDSSSDSDADMTDSEMIALDEKLADVFRARQANSNKKDEQKSAKVNIVNFKNRVLDMVDIYLRQEYASPNSLELVLPLLEMARSTNTKQLADRALELIRNFCGRCRGFTHAPDLTVALKIMNGQKAESVNFKSKQIARSKNEPEAIIATITTPDDALSILQSIHGMASIPNASNAHRSACSQASILVVKALIKAAIPVETVVGVYAATRIRQLVDPDCHVNERFFIDWGNWCGTVRGKLGNDEIEQHTQTSKPINAGNKKSFTSNSEPMREGKLANGIDSDVEVSMQQTDKKEDGKSKKKKSRKLQEGTTDSTIDKTSKSTETASQLTPQSGLKQKSKDKKISTKTSIVSSNIENGQASQTNGITQKAKKRKHSTTDVSSDKPSSNTTTAATVEDTSRDKSKLQANGNPEKKKKKSKKQST